MFFSRYLSLFQGSALIMLLCITSWSHAYQPTMAYVENLAIDFKFDDAGRFHKGVAAVMIAERGMVQMGLINKNGELLFQAEEIADFTKNVAPFRQNNQWGLVNLDGDVVLSAKYARMQPFADDRAAVLKDGLWGYVNPEGREIIARQFDQAAIFSESLAAVQNSDGLWGFINQDGQWQIPAQTLPVVTLGGHDHPGTVPLVGSAHV